MAYPKGQSEITEEDIVEGQLRQLGLFQSQGHFLRIRNGPEGVVLYRGMGLGGHPGRSSYE
jgi:hypothetical protein